MSLGDKFNVQAGNYVGIKRFVDIYTMRTRYIDIDGESWMFDGDGPNGPFNWRQKSDNGELKFVLLADEVGSIEEMLAHAEADVVRTDIALRNADRIASIRSHDSMDAPEAYEEAVFKAEEAWGTNNAARLYLKFLRTAHQGIKGEW